MGSVGLHELLVVALLGIVVLSIAFWLWMLVDCITNEPDEGGNKIVWVVVIALGGAWGGLVYLFARRPVRKREFGS